jgi:DNA-directed RNA polymerase subunit RPC12/RpoP
MRPGKTDDLFRCQSCGHPATDVFLFQYGLQPNLSVHATIYLKCQYCGYYDNR